MVVWQWLGSNVVALLSCAVAAAAFVRSRRAEAAAQRSADAAEETAKLDRLRWLEDHKPQFKVWHETRTNTAPHRSVVCVEKIGGDDCRQVEMTVETPAGFGTVFVPNVLDPISVGAFRDSDRHDIPGAAPDQNGGRMIVRCACVGFDGTQWTVRTPIDFRPAPRARVVGH